jgi:hypothetical protein
MYWNRSRNIGAVGREVGIKVSKYVGLGVGAIVGTWVGTGPSKEVIDT